MGHLVKMRETREINHRAMTRPRQITLEVPDTPRDWAALACLCTGVLHQHALDGTDKRYTALHDKRQSGYYGKLLTPRMVAGMRKVAGKLQKAQKEQQTLRTQKPANSANNATGR